VFAVSAIGEAGDFTCDFGELSSCEDYLVQVENPTNRSWVVFPN
jgi:hypothetical protein